VSRATKHHLKTTADFFARLGLRKSRQHGNKALEGLMWDASIAIVRNFFNFRVKYQNLIKKFLKLVT